MLCDREVAGKRNNVISMELHLYAGMLQAQEEAGVQGAAAPWWSARCPRSPHQLLPKAAIKDILTANSVMYTLVLPKIIGYTGYHG